MSTLFLFWWVVVHIVTGCYYYNLTFTTRITLDSPTFDNCIIDSCTFKNIDNDALQVYGVSNVSIKNCLFSNILEDAIHFQTDEHPKDIIIDSNRFVNIGKRAMYIQHISGLQFTNNYCYDFYGDNAITFRSSGYSSNALIKNNHFEKIYYNGINAGENHLNLTIINNTIINVGIELELAKSGAPHHGMYIQGAGFFIDSNVVYWVNNINGNCISVRSYGTVSNNILFNSTKRGITYYSDHPGLGGLLLIENNIIYDCPLNSIGISTNGNTQNHIGAAIIRFNTCLMNEDNIVITVDNDVDWNNYIYCNIVIRTGSTSYITNNQWINSSLNLGSSDINTIDFVTYSSDLVNNDLHLMESSPAVGFCDNLDTLTYVVTQYDIDGDQRNSPPNNRIDAGADQLIYVDPTTSTPTRTTLLPTHYPSSSPTITSNNPSKAPSMIVDPIQFIVSYDNGNSADSITVSSDIISINNQNALYFASIACKRAQSVVSVSGLSVTWTEIEFACSGREQTMVNIWYAYGVVTAEGTVIATFDSAPLNAVITITSYQNVDLNSISNPDNIIIGNIYGINGHCSGSNSGDDMNYFDYTLSNINQPEHSIIFSSVAHRHTAIDSLSQDLTIRSTNEFGSGGNIAKVSVIEMNQVTNGAQFRLEFSDYVDYSIIILILHPEPVTSTMSYSPTETPTMETPTTYSSTITPTTESADRCVNVLNHLVIIVIIIFSGLM